MKQFHIILIFALGFFLIPTTTFACEKHSSKKETSETVENDCSEKGHTNKSHDGCGGKCDHSQCGCATVFLAGITATDSIELTENAFSTSWKQPFYYTETDISSGFLSLWLIPKIS